MRYSGSNLFKNPYSLNRETLDELDQYISEPFPPPSDTSALSWWTRLEQRTRFLLLSKMAIDIYSIPAMSSEPECLKSWFRTGIYTQQDLHATVAAETVGMEVELELERGDD